MLANLRYADKNFRLSKVFIIVSFILISFAVLSIAGNPSNGIYEFSIYSSLPWYFWVSLFVSMVLGQAIVVIHLSKYKKRLLSLCAIIIALSNIILLALPFLRGYVIFGRGDVLSHIGWMKDIMQTGYVSSSNMYPLDHILGVSISYVSNIGIYDMSMFIPLFFSLFFMLSVFLLAREILPSRKQVLFATLLGSILLFGNAQVSFAPFQQSVFLFPFALFILFKSRTSGNALPYTALFICLLTLITFYHPLSALFFIAILIILRQAVVLSERLGIVDATELAPYLNMQKMSNLILIAVVIFCMWGAYVAILVRSVQRILDSMSDASDASQLASFSSIIESSNLSITTFMVTLFSMYGQYLLIIAVALVGIIYLFKNYIRGHHKQSPIAVILSLEFLFFIGASALAMTIVYIVGFTRFLSISILFAIFLIPLLFGLSSTIRRTRPKLKYHQNFLIVIFLSLVLVFSMSNLYASPTIRLANYQVTETELVGMDNFFQNRDQSIPIFELGIYQYRFYDALYGRSAERVNINYLNTTPPDHFGYGSDQIWWSGAQPYKYLLINEIGRESYPNIYPDFVDRWRFNEADFYHLRIDENSSMIYDNGNLQVFQLMN